MKTSVIFLLLVAAATALAQPTPEWTSPNLQGTLDQNIWIILRTNPPEMRYFSEDAAHIYIMDGVYSTNVAVTIIKPANCQLWINLGYDITGDGKNDLSMRLGDGTWPPPPGSGVRFVNTMTGQTIYEFINQGSQFYWYAGSWGSPDIDNDGWNELVIGREDTLSYGLNYLVYQTNGIASAPAGGGNPLPSGFSLNQNYPNPFNPATNITYEIAQPEPVEIQIFDPAGRLIRSYAPGVEAPGPHKWIWDGKNNGGSSVASGVYFYTLQAGSRTEAKKMIMLR